MVRLFVLISFFLISQCSIDRTISSISEVEKEQLSIFQRLADSNKTIIAGEEEPGESLLLCLTFVNKVNKAPLSNQRVKFYHTSSAGEYEPTDPSDESSARLNGTANTDEQGRIYVQTILPGDYGSSEDNRHIHTTVYGAHPEAYDIHFQQYSTFMFKDFVKGSDQHFLATLKNEEEGANIVFLTIEVKNPEG